MKTLIVIDIQKTYISKYDSGLVKRINERIEEAQKDYYNIVYVKNTKKLRSGKVTDEFYDELFIASENVFCKEQADAFSTEELVAYLRSKDTTEVEIVGVDGNSCVFASAKGAIKQGFSVSISLKCVGIANLSRFEKTKESMVKLGVKLL